MNKLSPRKGPSYYRLDKRQHSGKWSEDHHVPGVKFTSKNGNGKIAIERSDSNDSEQGTFSSHGRVGSTEMLERNGVTRDPSQVKSNQTKLSPPSRKTKLVVFFCSIIIIVGVALIVHFHEAKPETVTIGSPSQGSAQLILSQKAVNIIDEKRNTRIKISIAGENRGLIDDKSAQKCGNFKSNTEGVCLKWPSANATLQIIPAHIENSNTKCYNISWTSSKPYMPEDCIFLDNQDTDEKEGQPVWYDTINYILWSRILSGPCVNSCHSYIPTHDKDDLDIGGTIVEPFWLSSQGEAIKASLHNPLEACLKVCEDVSRPKLCLRRKRNVFGTVDTSDLSYMACFSSNVSEMQSDIMSKIVMPESEMVTDILSGQISDSIIKPIVKPLSERCSPLLEKPLWNIVFNGESYTDSKVIEDELKDIASIGGTGIVFNMSDVYSKIGDFNLHPFKNAKTEDFVSAMHRMDFKVMLPLSPFINYDAENFREAIRNGFLLKNKFDTAPVLGNAHMLGNDIYPAVIDFTHSDAFVWFVTRVKNFTANHGIDFIQLLYGQYSWLPKEYSSVMSLSNPAFHSSLYTKVTDYLESCPLSDVAFASQSESQVVMLQPSSGLEDSIKVALAAGLAGYPFIIPNLPFKLDEVDMLPSKMLEDGFIRWIQLVSFFPVAHMPWDFHILQRRDVNISRLVDTVKTCMALRNGKTIRPVLKLAIEKAEKTGHAPIISPIWKAPGLPAVSGSDFEIERVFLIDSQFMIGPDVMFAPVLEMNKSTRDLYFPPGRWKKVTDPGMDPVESDGKLWMKDYPANLDNTLIFIRES